jgi:hypothetical protein
MATDGEASHVNRTQEVAGSSPASSIRKRPAQRAFLFSSDEKMRKRVTVKVWSLTPSLSVSDDTVPAQATKEAHLQEL